MVWVLKTQLAIAPDIVFAGYVSDPASLTSLALEGSFLKVADTDPTTHTPRLAYGLRMKNADGSAYAITEAMRGSGAGMINLAFSTTANYGFAHLTTTSGFAGTALMGMGADVADSGLLLMSIKAATSFGLQINMENTIPDGTSAGLRIKQTNANSPGALFTTDLANSAPAVRLKSNVWGNTHHVIADHVDAPATTVYMQRMAKDGKVYQYANAHFGGDATDATSRTHGLEINYGRAAAETELRFYRLASGTPTWYAHRFYTSTDELRLGSSATGATVDGSETTLDIIRMKGSGGVRRLGFFNTAPATQPTAYTQTYSTAGKTVATMTAVNPTAATATAPAATAATNTTPYGYTTAAQADAIRAAVIALITDVASLRTQLTAAIADTLVDKQNLNAVIDDLQSVGLVL